MSAELEVRRRILFLFPSQVECGQTPVGFPDLQFPGRMLSELLAQQLVLALETITLDSHLRELEEKRRGGSVRGHAEAPGRTPILLSLRSNGVKRS
jgi:hypothetical protein